jgi:hypothetical protein
MRVVYASIRHVLAVFAFKTKVTHPVLRAVPIQKMPRSQLSELRCEHTTTRRSYHDTTDH